MTAATQYPILLWVLWQLHHNTLDFCEFCDSCTTIPYTSVSSVTDPLPVPYRTNPWKSYSITNWKMKRTAGWSCSVFFSFSSNSLAKATWWWMLLYRTLRRVPGTTKVRLWEKRCELWLQDVLLLLSFLLWCSDDRRKNTRTGTPWCIADWLLQVLRSRLIKTNY